MRGRAPALLFLLAAAPTFAGDAGAGEVAPPARYEGMLLADALARLESGGLHIIFSSDLVRPDMRVGGEPLARRPRRILDELLAAHGLQARAGPGGSLLVVRAPARGTITGIVRDGRGSHPLAGVRVAVAGTELRVVTDRRGRFTTPPLPAGAYALRAEHAAYLTGRFAEVPVTAGRATEVRLELTPRNVSSEEVVVTSDDSSARRDAPEPRWYVSREEIENTPRLAPDPLRALGRVPGVVEGDQSARLHIRGGAVDEVQIILDGLELYEPFHLPDRQGLFSIIDAREIDGVDVLDGGFPAEYGGRMSGVVDMVSRDPSGGVGIGVDLTSESARLVSEGALGGGRARWLASARGGYPGALLEGLGADPGYDPRYYDLFGKARIDPGGGTILTLDVLAARDAFEGEEQGFVNVMDDQGKFRSSHASTYAWLGLRQAWSSSLYSQTILSAGRLTRSRSGSSVDVAYVDDLRSTGLLGLKQSWFLDSGRHAVKWGFDAKHLQADYAYLSIPASPPPADLGPPAGSRVRRTAAGAEFGVHLADRVRLLPALHLEVGLRWDQQTYAPSEVGTLSPRVNLVYRPGSRSEFRFGWGYFHQQQRINELQVEDGVSGFFPAERSEHRVLSFEHRFAGDLRLHAGAYRKTMSDLRPRFENLFDPFAFFPESSDDRVRIAPDRGRAQGLELALRGGARGELDWSASYALASAEDEIDGRSVPRSWDQRRTLRLDLDAQIDENWRFTLAGIYHSGRPATPVTAETRLLPDGTLEVVPAVGSRNSERLAAVHRVDLGVTRAFDLQRTGLQLFVQLLNAFDRSSACCVERFDFDVRPDGRVDVERKERHGLPRMLVYGLRWSF